MSNYNTYGESLFNGLVFETDKGVGTRTKHFRWLRESHTLTYSASIWCIGIFVSIGVANAQSQPNAQLVCSNCRWPSVNNKGDIVWSQMDGGFWQVHLRIAASSGSSPAIGGQAPNHNNLYPVIDDAGNITYLKDGVGAGAGLSVISNQNGTEGTVEYSSGSPAACYIPPPASCPDCARNPGTQLCTSYRTAGPHFGVSPKSGKAISYFDFFLTSLTRTFDVSAGALQLNPLPNTYGYPDINENNRLVLSDFQAGQQQVYLTSAQAPTVALHTFPNAGVTARPAFARLNDDDIIVLVNGDLSTSGTITVYYPPNYGEASSWAVVGSSIGTGVWADINNDGLVVFEAVIGGAHQIFEANFQGIDASEQVTQANYNLIKNVVDPNDPNDNFAPQFLIQRLEVSNANQDDNAWPSLNAAPPGVRKAGYVNLDQKATGDDVVKYALDGAPPESGLNFIAVSIECNPGLSPGSALGCINLPNVPECLSLFPSPQPTLAGTVTQLHMRQQLWQTLLAVRKSGYKPILYAPYSWPCVVGTNLSEFGDFDVWRAGPATGLQEIGRQYRLECASDNGPPCVSTDRNVDYDDFPPGIFNLLDLSTDVAITLSGPPSVAAGTPVTLQASISNLGSNDASGLFVTFALPSGVVFVPGSSSGLGSCGVPSSMTAALLSTTTEFGDWVVCQVGALPKSGIIAGAIQVVRSQTANNLTITVVAGADNVDTTPLDNTATLTISFTAGSANLAVSQSVPSASTVGSNYSIDISLLNSGPSDALGVVLTDTLPSNVTFVSAAPSSGTCTGTGPVTCSLGTVSQAAGVHVSIVVNATSGGQAVNTASVTSTTPLVKPGNSSSTATTVANSASDLGMIATPSTSAPILGNTLTYTIIVTNGGPQAAAGVAAMAVIPTNATFVSATSIQGSCTGTSTVTCVVGNLANGASATISLTLKPISTGQLVTHFTVNGYVALRENPTGGPFQAAFRKTTNSVLVAAILCAFSSK